MAGGFVDTLMEKLGLRRRDGAGTGGDGAPYGVPASDTDSIQRDDYGDGSGSDADIMSSGGMNLDFQGDNSATPGTADVSPGGADSGSSGESGGGGDSGSGGGDSGGGGGE